MKKLATLTILCLFVFNSSFGQDRKKYSELINEASIFYDAKEYLRSGEKYSEAFWKIIAEKDSINLIDRKSVV